MALSCLVNRMTVSRCFFRGPTFGTTKNLMRSSVVLSNRDPSEFLTSKELKYNFLQNKVKYTLLPSSFGNTVSYSSRAHAKEPIPEYKKHSHVMIWQLERVLSAALLPLIPAAIFMPSPGLDTALAIMIVMHTHWGLEAIVVDYVRPILFGNIIPKVGVGLIYLFSAATLAGLINLIYNDFGLANSFIHFWKS